MRISQLQLREPFANILERTLADFLSKRIGQLFQVVWRQGAYTGGGGGQTWLCNPYLNIIFRPGIHREPLLPAVYEFSRSVKPWRTPMNKLYVLLATGRFTARFLATATVVIDPSLPNAADMVIIGGNHHIRLLDYHQRCCTVVTKHGFCVALMKAEIAVRSAHPYLPAPRILEKSADGSWYSEELILGTPINRLKDQRQAEDEVQQIVTRLFRLYEATCQSERIQHYIGRIVSRIDLHVGRNHLLTTSQRDNLSAVVQRLVCAASERSGDIATVQAHGDFQPANILVGDGGPWLIDWEYTTRRQAGYDGLVYALFSRRSLGLAQRLSKVLDGTQPLNNTLLASWPGLEWNDYNKRPATLALFLLEELDLKLMENDNRLFTSLDSGFSNFYQELMHILPLFERCGK